MYSATSDITAMTLSQNGAGSPVALKTGYKPRTPAARIIDRRASVWFFVRPMRMSFVPVA
ncbi:MAG: hypothetical protein JWO87_2173 [Phycisphaerales bacterium]|nr:hypothetical protein [Phycisphaerales bacterium]